MEHGLGGVGAGSLSLLGNKAKPLLGPLALRAEPLPLAARFALGGGLVRVAGLVGGCCFAAVEFWPSSLTQ